MVAARKLYPSAILAFPGGAQESVRNYLATHDVGLSKPKDIQFEQVSRLIMVDTQNPARLGPFQELCFKPGLQIHIFDHHPEGTEEAEAGLSVEVRQIQSVGATISLLAQQLEAAQLPLSPDEATLMALGLYEETGFFSYSSTTPTDLQAGAFLLKCGANLQVVADTLKSRVDPEQIALMHELLQSSETLYLDRYKVLLVSSTNERYGGDLVEVVSKLTDLPDLDAVISAIAMDEKVSIIGRSRGSHVNVGWLAEEFGGGGHVSAASASVKGKTVMEVREQLRRLLIERYRPAIRAQEIMTTPAISISQQATVMEAEKTLTKYQINVIPVVDRKGNYLGLLSRETVQKALFHKLASMAIADLLQTDAYRADPQTPFHEIQAHMIERNQRFVPILDRNKVVGVITRTDLIRGLHHDLSMSSNLKQKGDALPPATLRRNLAGKMMQSLPKGLVQLLRSLGEFADSEKVPLFAVGGFVRDLLLGRENFDVDLVTEGDAISFAKKVGRQLQAKVTVHDRFGTAVLTMPDGVKIDMATARTEYYEYPTALPTVEQSSLKKDLYRRDFTINALAVRLNKEQFGDLIDFYGGQRDINAKTIRVLHSLSFVEDPTRVFRAIRFEQRFGFRLGKETLSFIKSAERMELFHRLASSRLSQELVLLLSDEEPRKALERLEELNLLRFIHSGLHKSRVSSGLLKAVEDALDWYQLLYLDVPITKWVVYMMAIFDGLSTRAVGEVVRRLKIPGRQAEKIRISRSESRRVLERFRQRTPLAPSAVGRLLEEYAIENVIFFLAKAKSESVKRQISAFVTSGNQTRPTLSGTDLKSMGLKPGPLFKKILQRLKDARVDGEVTSETQERELVRQLIAQQKGTSV